jgi:hypothetical protein
VKKALIALGALVVLLVCCGVGGALFAGVDAPDAHLPAPASSSPATKSPAPVRPVTAAKSLKDGQWLIGTDAPAGRYQSSGPDRGLFCYWQITTDPTAEPGQKGFITNDAPPGRSYVNLRKGQYFKTSNCGPWTLIP